MTQEEKTQEQLRNLTEREIQTFVAKVTAIDKDAKTIAVEDIHGIEYLDVRLSAVIAEGDKMVAYPKQGTWVLVSVIENMGCTLFVSSFSEIEEIEGKIEGTEYVINKDGYNVNREGENLYTVLDDLIQNVDEQNKKVQAVAQELMNVVVSIGVTPNVPALTKIVQDLVQIITDRGVIKGRLNTILIA